MRARHLRWRLVTRKPVVLQAFQTTEILNVETVGQNKIARPGDWIVKGVTGDIFPCRPEIFKKMYKLEGETVQIVFRCPNCKNKWTSDEHGPFTDMDMSKQLCTICQTEVIGEQT